MIPTRKDVESKVRSLISNTDQAVLNRLVSEKDKPMSTSFSGRMLPTAIGGLSMLGATTAASKYLKKIKWPIIAGATLAGGATGYLFPDTYNAVLENKQNKLSGEDVKKIIAEKNRISQSMHAIPEFTQNFYKDITKLHKDLDNAGVIKTSSFGSIASRVSKPMWSGAKTLLKTIPAGLGKIPKNAPLGKKIFGYTTKGLAAAGAIYGGSKIVKSVTAPRSQSNYNTFLRNNILAGNINPNEVQTQDAQQVNELGMR